MSDRPDYLVVTVRELVEGHERTNAYTHYLDDIHGVITADGFVTVFHNNGSGVSYRYVERLKCTNQVKLVQKSLAYAREFERTVSTYSR